jgi:hypothetical protein
LSGSETKLAELKLEESDVWIFNSNGSLYFIRAPTHEEAAAKFRQAQITDGIQEPVAGVGHKIKIWE